MLYIAGLFHICFLVLCSKYALRVYNISLKHKILACFLLIWFNLVLTGLTLGLLNHLNNLYLYALVSCLYSLISVWAIRGLLQRDRRLQVSPLHAEDDTKWRFSPFIIFTIASMVSAIACSTLIISFYYPNNYDAVAYRLARAFLYLGKGNLGHPNQDDFRVSFYPLNGPLAYIFFAIYQFDGRWFNLFGFGSWLMCALGVYTLGRDCGASREGALLSAAAFLLAPIAIALSASNNDEIVEAAPILIGLIFLKRWWTSGSLIEVVLGGIGIGLGAGTKLHLPQYLPILLAACFQLSRYLFKHQMLFAFVRSRKNDLIIAGGLIVILSSPFIMINLRERGSLMPTEIVNIVQNKPFDSCVAVTNTIIFTSQMLLSPIPDLIVSPDTHFKLRIYEGFNRFFNEKFFFWISSIKNHNAPSYPFRGIADPLGWWSFEQTVWIGFTPLLLGYALWILWKNRGRKGAIFSLWLIMSFFVWHLSFSMTNRYGETVGTYYSFPLSFGVSGLAVFWDMRRNTNKLSASAIKFLFLFILVTDFVFAFNLYAFNVQRNVKKLAKSGFAVQDMHMPDNIKQTIKKANKVHIVYTRWEVPLFHFMNKNPGAQYTSNSLLKEGEDVLNLLLYPTMDEFGHLPVRVVDSAKGRLTLLGTIATVYGNELVFGKGNDVERDNPQKSNFIVLHLNLKYAEDGATVMAISFVPPASPDFLASEFRDGLRVETLCNRLSTDGYEKAQRKSRSIKLLNNLLELPDLYQIEEKPASDNLQVLKNKYARTKKTADLKILNRAMLEEFYPNETPKRPLISGSDDADHFEYRIVQIAPDGEMLPVVEWFDQSELLYKERSMPAPARSGYLKVQVREITNRKVVYEAFFPLTKGEELDILKDEGTILGELAELRNVDIIKGTGTSDIKIDGMGPLEGPYLQWDLPHVRWATKNPVTIKFGAKQSDPIRLSMSFRPQIIPDALMLVKLNGKVLKQYKLTDPYVWKDDTLNISPQRGKNVIEFLFSVKTPSKDTLCMLFRTLALRDIGTDTILFDEW